MHQFTYMYTLQQILYHYSHFLMFAEADISSTLHTASASVIQDNGPVTLSALDNHFSRHSIKQRLAPFLP